MSTHCSCGHAAMAHERLTDEPRPPRYPCRVATCACKALDYCGHSSASGVDMAPANGRKVWRCDTCGWLYRDERQADGSTRMVGVS